MSVTSEASSGHSEAEAEAISSAVPTRFTGRGAISQL